MSKTFTLNHDFTHRGKCHAMFVKDTYEFEITIQFKLMNGKHYFQLNNVAIKKNDSISTSLL